MQGGGGGGSGMAPQNFLPPGQGEVAGQLPGLIGPMRDQSISALSGLNGISPAQQAYPNVLGTTSNILNNPYQGQAIAGAEQGADIFKNNVLPGSFEGAGALRGLVGTAGSAIDPIMQSAFGNPAYGQAQGYGGSVAGNLAGYLSPLGRAATNPAYGRAQQIGGFGGEQLGGAIGPALSAGFSPNFQLAQNYGGGAAGNLSHAADSIIQSAFDPQRQLYDRTLQQVMDQQNAINSQYGIASSPYGAGVAGQRASDFNLDWQDRQLGRQTSGGQAAAGLYGQGVNDLLSPALGAVQGAAGGIGAANAAGQGSLSSLLTPANTSLGALASGGQAAAGIGEAGIQSLLRPANAQVSAGLQGSGALGNLSGIANQSTNNALGILRNLSSDALSTAAAPYSTYNTIQGNNFGALQNEINLGNANYLLPQQTVSNLEQYLGLGQSASQIASQIAGTNNNIGSTNFNQLASGLGGASQLAFGSQGPFGSGGLFGSLGGGGGLFGGGAGAAADLSSAVEGGVFGGGGDLLASAAPLAFSA